MIIVPCKLLFPQMKRIVFLFLLLISQIAFSQKGEVKFSHLSIKDGLSQSAGKCILKDSKGFMWFGTGDGLNRYDGYEFVIYRHDQDDPFSIGGNDIACIYEDLRDSTLWIGTQDGGLNKYDHKNDRFIVYKFAQENPSSLKCNDVRAIEAGEQGELWIGTYGGGLFQFDIQDERFVAYENQLGDSTSIADNHIYAISKTPIGELWIGTGKGLCKMMDDEKNLSISFENYGRILDRISISIRTIYVDTKGKLWLGTQFNGLVEFDPKTGIAKQVLINEEIAGAKTNKEVRAICETRDGNFWIGTMNGLYLLQAYTGEISEIKHDPLDAKSLSCNQVYSLYIDNSGLLWVGTYIAGLSKLDKYESKFPHYNNLLGSFTTYSQNDIRTIFKDWKSRLWIGSSDGVICMPHKPDCLLDFEPKRYLREKQIRHIYGSNSHELFVSTSYDILRYDKSHDEFVSIKDEIRAQTKISARIGNTFGEDRNGNLWFGVTGGLVKYDSKNKAYTFYSCRQDDKINSEVQIISIQEDQQGKLWLGSINNGLLGFDPEKGVFENYMSEPQDENTISSDKVFSVLCDKPGVLWLGTNRGLNRLDLKNKSFKSYQVAEGLINNVVYALLKDKKGNIWGSTNGGVFVFDPLEEIFRNYTFKDGLQSNEFNQGAYHISKDGEIFFGGINGFNVFYPEQIQDNPNVPPVVITAFQLFYKPVKVNDESGILKNPISETKKIVLDHTQSVFSFEFTSLNFTLSQNNKYQYKLEGYDKEWVSIGTRRTASYTNLNHGTYTFMVKGSNNDGVWNDTPASIQIEILPPFWKTKWFVTLFIGLILLFVYAIFYYRLRGIKQKKLELEKQVKEKTKEVLSQKGRIEANNKELRKQNDKVSYQNEKIEGKNEELKTKNEQILKQRDELLVMAEQVREANQAKLRFFTNISHEFRTPLTLILGPIQQLLSSEEKESVVERKQKMEVIKGNASKLLHLVNQIMDFRKVENEKMQLHAAPIDIVNFVEKIAFLFNDLAQRKKIDYQFVSERKRMDLYFDPEKMEKIIFNLLSNAFKFTPENEQISIHIEYSDKNGVQEIQEIDQYISISVEDRGMGIPEGELPYIYERFYQLNNSDSSFESGSGIGLALVKKFVDLHHGEIEVKSKIGEGSKFTVLFPTGNDHLSEEELVKDGLSDFHLHEEFMASNIQEYHSVKLGLPEISQASEAAVLIVEDNKDLRGYIVDILSKKYKVFEAENGDIGIELASKFLPDLIVSDVMMPGIDGFELCAKVKSDLKTSHIPVVLLTALSSVDQTITGLEAGADAYISKPFDPLHLEISIRNLIQSREMLKEKFSKGLSMDPKEVTKTPADQKFLEKAIKAVEVSMNDSEFGIDSYCEKMNVSQAQLYRKLKALTGLSINEFVRNLRLKRGAELLLKGELNINEVAFEVGFNDPNYFSKCFLKQYSQTPSDFIKSRA